jgi:phage baseplate assembly protein W
MKAIGPQLPLQRDNIYGQFSLITTYKEEIKQNFKNLLLTVPGEKMMNPEFGVGLRNFLFEPRDNATVTIRQTIQEQIDRYMPFIRNLRLNFDSNKDKEFLKDSNILSLTIIYDIPSLNVTSEILVVEEEIT